LAFSKHINPLIICCALISFLIITGCSSSSNSIRYGSGNNERGEKDTRFRYSDNSEEDYENDPDISPDEIETVDVSEIKQKYFSSGEINNPSTPKEKMLMEILKYINTPYQFGGNSKNGIDCSAFTQRIYNSCSIKLLRSAREQYMQGIEITDRDNLKFGDLVFFDTRKTVKPGHVGIYLDDNLFVHASSKNGVIVTPLNSDYYSERFMGARRINFSSDFQ
jgi:cell wall-associated NlpC family hydrolase